MKRILSILAIFALATSFGSAATIKLKISNPNPVDVTNAPVVVSFDKIRKTAPKKRAGLSVLIDNQIISSQTDDLNKDGIADELVFLIDLRAGEEKEVVLKSIRPSKRPVFAAEVDASLILKTDEGMKPVTEASSTKNDMYNKLHHHGVAFESELMAYRIYFDNKSTIDIYGKKKPQLELELTGWYPTEEQLAAGFGDDILLVSGWIGNGTVKGWDGNKATHIDKFDLRTHRIVAKGNVRTVVESEVKGWNYEGKKTDITVRYIMYARHRDVTAEVRVSNDIGNLATGVQQIGGGPCFQTNQLVGSWGTWYPQPDTVKYAKETVGLGLYLPKEFPGQQHMDGVNNVIITPAKAGDVLRFHFTTVATKEENQPISTASEFFEYLDAWRKGLAPLVVK